jgi:hypothetical protein
MLDFLARLLSGIPDCSDGPRSGDPLAIEEDHYRFRRAGESRDWRPTAVVRPQAPDPARAAWRPVALRSRLPRVRRPLA